MKYRHLSCKPSSERNRQITSVYSSISNGHLHLSNPIKACYDFSHSTYLGIKIHHHHYHHHYHHHIPGHILQTSATMAFQSSLSSVLLMRSMLGDSFVVTYLFGLSLNFVCCLTLLLVPHIFPLNICFSSPSALFICTKIVVVFF